MKTVPSTNVEVGKSGLSLRLGLKRGWREVPLAGIENSLLEDGVVPIVETAVLRPVHSRLVPQKDPHPMDRPSRSRQRIRLPEFTWSFEKR